MATAEEKIANPLNYYATPVEVDRDPDLSVDEKIKLLLNWLDDINQREIAEAENMLSHNNSRGHYIAQIETLLRNYRSK